MTENSIQVILNADDFGSSTDVNAAIVHAYREGVLTSASLMVAGDAVEEAVALARSMPGLAVGLHVVVVNGKATLPPAEIPHLVDAHGNFPDNPLSIGLLYALNRAARDELHRELEAQFERFAATGLPLSHVDGHLLMHMHPTVLNLLLPLAERYGACGLRVPRDELVASLPYSPPGLGIKIGWAIAFGLLCRQCLRQLERRELGGGRLVVTDRVYGLMQSGHMTEAYVVSVLQRLRLPTAELYFHPACGTARQHLGPNPGDLATLTSPQVRQIIQQRNLQLTTYRALRKKEIKLEKEMR